MTERTFSGNHFRVQFDGGRGGAFLRSVDGGYAKAAMVSEPTGTDNLRILHTSMREIDPVTLEVGMADSRTMIDWINDSISKQHSRRSGAILHADFDKTQRMIHEFRDALIQEITFPALDASSKDSAYLKVKFLPEWAEAKRQRGPRVTDAPMGPRQKLWNVSAFRLTIDGVPLPNGVNKIESFSIKQGIKALHIGGELYPEIEPTKIEMPELSIQVSLEHSGALMDWYQGFIRAGAGDAGQEKTGALEFLAPDRQQVLFTIELNEVAIKGFSVLRSDAGGSAIKRAKADLYIGELKLKPGPGLE